MKIDLVRDCLDKQLVSPDRRKLGRVDGIVLDIGGRGRPRVAEIHVGVATLAERLPRPLSAWLKYVLQKLPKPGYVAIEWRHLTIKPKEVLLDSEEHRLEIRRVETWVRKHVVQRIPGA
jgi:hypothetical protein